MTRTHSDINILRLDGTPGEAGRQHGRKLKNSIAASYELYHKFMFHNVPDSRLKNIGQQYLQYFFDFNESYVEEINGIAQGAGIEPWQIVLLNARNEVYHYLKGNHTPNECTAFFFPKAGILAQNWDWVQAFEDLFVICIYQQPDGHQILQMTEPGLIGKVGLNSSGLGVCLNFLPGRNNDIGIPVHLLLRTVLDCKTIEEARERINNAPSASFSNLMAGDKQGRYFDIELKKLKKFSVAYPDMVPIHTNHYLADPNPPAKDSLDPVEKTLVEDSMVRYLQADKLTTDNKKPTVQQVRKILRNRDNVSHRICSGYKSIMDAQIGTVCSIVMDLNKLEMSISKGNHPSDSYTVVGLKP